MREILFRGKRTDNGEWVYGGVCDYGGGVSIFEVEYYNGSLYESPYTDLNEIDVDPVTVGQYTGMTDKSGKQIFEGDIVKLPLSEKNCKVTFKSGCFVAEYGSCGFTVNNSLYGGNLEVIGNIYDNTELLEEEI
jgi:uncharacterized phage protein (TIGR01671 family)